MAETELVNFGLVVPEAFLAVASMVLLLLGVYTGKDGSFKTISWLSVATLLVALVLTLITESGEAFFGQFIVDPFAEFAKVLIISGSLIGLIMSIGYAQREGMARFEFPILIVLATLGMMMMVSANDLLALYLGLELQSLSLYVVAAIRRDTARSTESGLKYFVLGSLASGMILYGASMVYGFTGTTSFTTLAEIFAASEELEIGALVGLAFVIAGLCFKVSAVPFHMWTPDVYEGAPTPVTAFFAVAPKIAGLALFVRVVMGPFGAVAEDWQQIVAVVAVLSMVLGSFAAIRQNNMKRLMAYSSIGHVGFALVGLAAATEEGVRGLLIYLGIYLFMNVGVFAAMLGMRRNGRMLEQISDLAGLSRNNPLMAAVLAVLMFSMAGIPPLAGFFGKFYVFMAAVEAQMYSLAVIGLVTSVVSAFYYLRIIKVMYFDAPAEAYDRSGTELNLIMGVSTAVMLLFVFFQTGLLGGAAEAAASLFAAG